jgi:hypothetical protein
MAKLPALEVLPMQVKIGDRVVDETGEYEVIGRTIHDGGQQNRARARPESRQRGRDDDSHVGRA